MNDLLLHFLIGAGISTAITLILGRVRNGKRQDWVVIAAVINDDIIINSRFANCK